MDWIISTALAAEAATLRTPWSYDLITYVWVIGWAVSGGFVNFMRKMREGSARAFNFTEFIGEMFTSGFVGVLTFLLCEWAGINPMLSAFFIAITGHMGSRALFVAEKLVQGYAEKKTGVIVADPSAPKPMPPAEPVKKEPI